MTEQEWLDCTEPRAMLRYLENHFPERNLYLLGCAWWRHAWGNGAVQEAQDIVEIVERIADGTVSHKRLRKALAAQAIPRDASQTEIQGRGQQDARYLAVIATSKGPWEHRFWWHSCLSEPLCVTLIREVFGNPFRHAAINPLWRTPLVTSLAEAAYHERVAPNGNLDRDRLAILSDALEEAGCTHAEILAHLRGPGPHVRGCWALDLAL